MIEWLVDQGLFRNSNHAIWFLCTVGILAVLIIQRLFPRFVWLIPLTGLIVHVPPLITSFVRVVVRKQASDLYSRDCIWYNAAMLLIYTCVYLILAHSTKLAIQQRAV